MTIGISQGSINAAASYSTDSKCYVDFSAGGFGYDDAHVGDAAVIYAVWSYAAGFGVDAYELSEDVVFSGSDNTVWHPLDSTTFVSVGGKKVSITCHYTTNLRTATGGDGVIFMKPLHHLALYDGQTRGLSKSSLEAVLTSGSSHSDGVVGDDLTVSASATLASRTDYLVVGMAVNQNSFLGAPLGANDGWQSQLSPDGVNRGRVNNLFNDGSANTFDPGVYGMSGTSFGPKTYKAHKCDGSTVAKAATYVGFAEHVSPPGSNHVDIHPRRVKPWVPPYRLGRSIYDGRAG